MKISEPINLHVKRSSPEGNSLERLSKFQVPLPSEVSDSKLISEAMITTDIPVSGFASTLRDDKVFEDLADLEVLTGFTTGYGEASTSTAGFQHHLMQEFSSSASRKGKSQRKWSMKKRNKSSDSMPQFAKVFKRKANPPDISDSQCQKKDKNTVVFQEPPLDQ